jgi:hypothetical protein
MLKPKEAKRLHLDNKAFHSQARLPAWTRLFLPLTQQSRAALNFTVPFLSLDPCARIDIYFYWMLFVFPQLKPEILIFFAFYKVHGKKFWGNFHILFADIMINQVL